MEAERGPYPYHLQLSMSKRLRMKRVGGFGPKRPLLDRKARPGWSRSQRCALVARAVSLEWSAALLMVAGCRPDTTPNQQSIGCTKDADCKEQQRCEAGRCQNAAPAGLGGDAPRPEHSGGGHDRGLADAARGVGRGPAQAPKVAWEAALGSVIHAPPVISARPGDDGSGGSVPVAWVGTHAGRFVGVVAEGQDEGTLTLDVYLGGMIWSAAAVGKDGRIFVGADDDTLYAIDPVPGPSRIGTGGRIAWSLRLGDCQPPRAPGPEGVRCDVDGGPVLGPDGDLFVGADGLYRIAPDGTIRWHYTGNDEGPARHVYSAPLLVDDELVVFGGQDGFITAVSGSGEERWRYEVKADVDGSAARGLDGTVMIGADDGVVYAFDPDGSLRWTYTTGDDIRSGIAVSPMGGIFVTSTDGTLHALDPTGAPRFMVPTQGPITTTPRLDLDHVVYFGSQDDRLYAVTSEGQVRWSVEFPADIDSSVAIAPGGTLVVGCDDGVLRGLR